MENALNTVFVAIVTAVLSSGLSVEIYKRLIARRDKTEDAEKETSAEKIIDRRELTNKLWEQVEKLQSAERVMIDEQRTTTETLAELRGELRAQKILNDEQGEEIGVHLRRIKELEGTLNARDLQIRRLQSGIEKLERDLKTERRRNPHVKS